MSTRAFRIGYRVTVIAGSLLASLVLLACTSASEATPETTSTGAPLRQNVNMGEQEHARPVVLHPLRAYARASVVLVPPALSLSVAAACDPGDTVAYGSCSTADPAHTDMLEDEAREVGWPDPKPGWWCLPFNTGPDNPGVSGASIAVTATVVCLRS